MTSIINTFFLINYAHSTLNRYTCAGVHTNFSFNDPKFRDDIRRFHGTIKKVIVINITLEAEILKTV